MKKEILLQIAVLILTFLAGLGVGYLLRGEQAKTPIIIEKTN